MPKTTGKNPMPMMLTVLAITPNTKHIRSHPNHADNQPVRNLNRSNATRDRHNANPRHVKVLRSNARPNPNRGNKASVAGTLLLNPTPPRKTPVFRADFHTAGFCSFPTLSRSSRLQIQQYVETRAAAYPNRCTFAPSATARNHPLTGGFILPA